MSKRKMKVGELRRLIETMMYETEVAPFTPTDQTRREGASMDNQIDEYIQQYETEAQQTQNEGMNFGAMVRRFLNEAEGDEEEVDPAAPAAPPPDPNAGAGGAPAVPAPAPAAGPDTSIVPAEGTTPVLPADSIDMESFCGAVHRLIENHEALLEVRNTIFRRAFNYLLDHYEPEAVKLFENIMRDEYATDDQDSGFAIEDEDRAAPDAVGAGPDIASSAGGGA